VNSTVESAPSPSPFRLETFGTLLLREAEGGAPTVDHGQQRWRLALLAVLAASGAQGASRDRLLLLFWPDASQERARHSLEQLLYKMRKSMGASVFAGVNPLRLDAGVVTSDVEDFQRAIGAGDLETAVGHYRGPFLDGFYLGDSPEFEEWMIGERARLESAYAEALEQLAEKATDAAEHGSAVRWRRELGRLDPLSGRHALGLMRALAESGDHAAALRHGERYERLVRQELGTGAGPEIAALVAEIHARTAVEPSVARRPPAGDGAIQRSALIPVPSKMPEARSPDSRPAGRRRFSRRLLMAVAAVASLAVVLFAGTRMRRAPAEVPGPTAAEASIAVLPLDNLSGDPADAALADGMTQELIATLGRSGDLRVIASTSVFALDDRGMDARQIADSLRVSHLLEGGVRKTGSRLRVQVRLVDARDGSTRWSETYDREIGDIFEMQEEISLAVGRELDVRLAGGSLTGPTPGRLTPNAAAYEWYLRGITAELLGGASGRAQGIDYLHRAIAADSNFAPAYARLTWMYLNSPGDYREWNDRAEEAALRAIALDDSLAEAHSALGWARYGLDDYGSAEAELKRAIDLDPNVHRGYEGLARVYLMTGRPAEQLAVARLGMEIDPFSIQAMREMALALNMNGRCDETLELLHPLKSLGRPAGVAAVILGICYAKKEMWPEAIEEFRWATEETDARTALAFLGYSLARGGRREEAMRILSDLLAGRRNSHGAFGIAVVYAGLRDYDQAFDWLDKAVEEGSVRVYIMDPVFEDLHRDERFERFRAHLGLQ
jgi:TolB-like protein/DNA-binding SARP family transcriptional activator/Flp pilus assembly protein TadD